MIFKNNQKLNIIPRTALAIINVSKLNKKCIFTFYNTIS